MRGGIIHAVMIYRRAHAEKSQLIGSWAWIVMAALNTAADRINVLAAAVGHQMVENSEKCGNRIWWKLKF